MSLIDNLNTIKNCKENIKSALINKGVDMTDVAFSDYASKINALHLESGDGESSTPVQTVDYIYTNGYLLNGEKSDIITFTPYKMDDFKKGEQYIIDIICPDEIPGYIDGDNKLRDVIFTVDVPTTYNKPILEYYEEGTQDYYLRNFKTNPRHSIVIRDGVEYNSYVRDLGDNDYGNEGVSLYPLQYRITIEKK